MPEQFPQGVFIAVEGIDGSGKTTQIRLLAEALRQAGEPVVTSREPTSGPWGQKIRASAVSGRMSLTDELDAFVHDRTQHVNELILPSLREGQIVILDRYFYSSIAYQGSRGGDVAAVKQLMESRFPVPDLVVLLDISPETGIVRIARSRGDVPNQFETLEGLAKARAIFNSLEGEHIFRIDAGLPPEEIHSRILQRLLYGPLKAKRCAEAAKCEASYCAKNDPARCRWLRLSRALTGANASAR